MSAIDAGYAERLRQHDVRLASPSMAIVDVRSPNESMTSEEKIAAEIERLSNLRTETLQRIINCEVVEAREKATYEAAVSATVSARQDELQCLDDLTKAIKQQNQL